MLLRRTFTAATVLALAQSGAGAATVQWSIGPNFGGPNGAQGILTNGTLVQAIDLRSAASGTEVVDPGGTHIVFTGVDSPWFNNVFTDPPNGIGDPVWSSIVSHFEWNTGADVNAPTFLSGLTVGATYQVQFFAGRSSTCCGNRTLRFGDGAGDWSTPIGMGPNSFVSVVGTFVASATTQAIQFDDSSNNPILNAYVLRDVSAVPEPGSAALWLGGLLACAWLRRR